MSILSMTKEKLSILTNLFFFTAGIVVILVSLVYKLNKSHIGLAFLLPPLVYMMLKGRVKENQEILHKSNRVTFCLLTIILVIIMCLSLLDWYVKIYQRSILFFVLVTIAYLIIIKQVFFAPNGKYTSIILLEIFTFAVIVRGSVYFNFPTVYGHDPFFHLNGIEQTISSGFLSPLLERYTDFSFMHLLTMTLSQILGIDLKIAYFANSLIEVLSALFVFIICRMISNEKIGLLSTAIITIAPYNIFWGFWITPITFSLGFFMLIIYLVIKKTFNSSRKIIGLLIFLLLSSIFVHPILSFVTSVTLILIAICQRVYKVFLLPSKNVMVISSGLIILFVSAMFLYWMHAYAPAGSNFFYELSYSLITSLRRVGTAQVTEVTLAPLYDYSSIFLNDLPFTLVLFFGVLGLIFVLNNNPSSLKFALVFASIFLIVLVYSLGFLAMDVFLPQRWFPFIEVMLALFAAYGVYILVSNAKTFKRQLFLACTFFFILIFSATTSPITNSDSSFYAKELVGRSALIESEVIAATFVRTHFTGLVSRDAKYHLIKGDILNPNDFTTYSDRMVVLRNYDVEKGFDIPLFGAGGKLLEIIYADQHFYDNISHYNIIYENGEVRAYFSPPR